VQSKDQPRRGAVKESTEFFAISLAFCNCLYVCLKRDNVNTSWMPLYRNLEKSWRWFLFFSNSFRKYVPEAQTLCELCVCKVSWYICACFYLRKRSRRRGDRREGQRKVHLFEKRLRTSSTVNKIVIAMFERAKNWKESVTEISTLALLQWFNAQGEKRKTCNLN
jgi:hypothetical protein